MMDAPGFREPVKVRQDLAFYFWTGAVLYLLNNLLNGLDFYQRYGWDFTGYAGFAVYFGINLGLLNEIRKLRNWARNLFIVKFVVFALMFYPQTVLLKGGSWMYSDHFPHSVFQRMSNFGNLAYEIFFLIYLVKKSVRFAFVHA